MGVFPGYNQRNVPIGQAMKAHFETLEKEAFQICELGKF